MVVIIAAEANELERFRRQWLQRQDAFDPSQLFVRNLGVVRYFKDDPDLAAAPERHDYKVAGAQRELVRAIVEQRG
jgi:hypothetical protein